jgi:hypothetical protein
MPASDSSRENLRFLLRLLEQSNAEAVRAKQQVARIIEADYQVGNEIFLIPSAFEVESVTYHATVTPDQLALIQSVANGSTDYVYKYIRDHILVGNIYEAGYQILDILVQALANQLHPAPTTKSTVKPAATSVAVSALTTPGCQFDTGCQTGYSQILCKKEGGMYLPNGCPPKPATGGSSTAKSQSSKGR